MIKKTVLSEYGNVRKNGIAAITLQKNDVVKDVKLTDGTQDILIGTHDGLAIRFHEREARAVGRTSIGVRGIKLGKGDKVVGAVAVKRRDTSILVAAENGFGKRSELDDYRVSHRSGKGVITLRATDKTGKMVAIKEVLENDDIVVVTAQGVIIRQPAKQIRIAGRNTQGVRLIRLEEQDKVTAIAAVPSEEEAEEEVTEEKSEKKKK
jgi:DNA gyrase subunit A